MKDRSLTDLELSLRSQLEAMRDITDKLPSDYHYRGMADFVLREGQFFEPRSLPGEFNPGAAKHCFRNAALTALKRKLPYVEGYALRSVNDGPFLHGWNLDLQEFVVDTTWVPVSGAYLGVILPLLLFFHAKGSVLNDWENGFPLLREPWKGEAARDKQET